MKISQIGRCRGCDRAKQLDEGVCRECLDAPNRGRKWAEMSYRCRTEPDFALAVFLKIQSERGREIFVKSYGLPPGAERALGPRVHSVQ
jgi:hypothetical protein